MDAMIVESSIFCGTSLIIAATNSPFESKTFKSTGQFAEATLYLLFPQINGKLFA